MERARSAALPFARKRRVEHPTDHRSVALAPRGAGPDSVALHRGVRHGGMRLGRADRAGAGLRSRVQHRAARGCLRQRQPAFNGPARVTRDVRPRARGRAHAGPHASQGGAGVPPPQERVACAGSSRVREPRVRPAQAHVPWRRRQQNAHQQGKPRPDPIWQRGATRGARHDASRVAFPERPRTEPQAVQHRPRGQFRPRGCFRVTQNTPKKRRR
mmetsp:Transcript_7344/g.30557  ORF Transcript_7344/g.30557 Transcript_7344/m.30557 type:complete len:215 (+) Transcript_7344:1116-1760(+)